MSDPDALLLAAADAPPRAKVFRFAAAISERVLKQVYADAARRYAAPPAGQAIALLISAASSRLRLLMPAKR